MYEARYWGTLSAYTILDIAGWVHTCTCRLPRERSQMSSELMDVILNFTNDLYHINVIKEPNNPCWIPLNCHELTIIQLYMFRCHV